MKIRLQIINKVQKENTRMLNTCKTVMKALLLVAFIFSICGTSHAGDKVRVRLHYPPPNKMPVASLWKMDIENSTKEGITIYLKGTASGDKQGDIVNGTSKPFIVKPGKRTYGYNDFKSGEIKWSNKTIQEIIIRTGDVREDSYTICVTAFYENNEIADNESCIQQTVRKEGSITLISPADGDTIPQGQPLIFTWLSSTSARQGEKYTIKIGEIVGNEPPVEALQKRTPWFEKTDIAATTFTYSNSARPLADNKTYCWAVGRGGVWSEAFTFNVNQNTTQKRTGRDIPPDVASTRLKSDRPPDVMRTGSDIPPDPMSTCSIPEGSWNVGGNDIPNSNYYLGTCNNAPLAIGTNNNEIVRLTTNGRVGIGTTEPISKLHIKGNSNWPNCDVVLESRNGKKWDLAVGDNGNFSLSQPSTNLSSIEVLPNGNVGIGISVPEAKLDVRSRIQVRGPGYAYPDNFTGIELINDGTDMYSRAMISFRNIAPTNGHLTQFLQNEGSSNSFIMRNHPTGGGFLDYLNFNLGTNDIIFNANKSADEYGNVLVNNGKVGIGTSNPIQNLDVNGRVNVSNGVIQRGGAEITNTSDLGLYSRHEGNWMRFVTNKGPIRFYSDDGIGTNPTMTIDINGSVSIGEHKISGPHADYKLCVDGKIVAKIFKVTTNESWWSDFVLKENYNLPSLIDEVAPFIKIHGHLPNVPNQKDILNDGLDLGKMDAIILQKIEELYLYSIEQQKTIENLKQQNKLLLKRMKCLEKR